MTIMRPLRALAQRFRLALVIIFGFMSLAHGVVLACPHGAGHAIIQQQDQQRHTALHHHSSDVLDQQEHDYALPDEPEDGSRNVTAICYMHGCFVAVVPRPIGTPRQSTSPLQELSPASAAGMAATDVDPSVPPPRIQV
jgi:hypothetical protein